MTLQTSERFLQIKLIYENKSHKLQTYFCVTYIISVGWDISVSIATGYGLKSPDMESRWGRGFPHLS